MSKEEQVNTTVIPFDVKSNAKFVQMREVFEKLFRAKGYIGNKKFEKDVWFMQNDIPFQNMIRPSSTPNGIEINKMHSLLRELNENMDFKALSVDTSVFIDRVCEILFKAHHMVTRSKELIKEYNAHENVNVLDYKLKILNEKLKENTETVSKLEASVSRVDHLPEGEYQLNFHFMEMNPGDPSVLTSKNHRLRDNKSLSIKQGGDIIVLSKLDLSNCFDVVNLSALDINDNAQYLGSFEYSGTTLSTFNLQLFKNNELFAESSPECFLDMFLNLIEKIRDIEQSFINTTWKIKTKTNFEQSQINNLLPDYQIILVFKFDLDPLTRACIIKRILYLLKDAIKTQSQNEITKNEILDVYFRPISDEVKHILTRKEEESGDNNLCYCQNGCTIY